MATIQTKIINEIQILEALRNALGFFEDKTNIVYSSEFKDPETGFVFTSTKDLLNSLHELGIQGNTLKEAGIELEQTYEILKQNQTNTTELPQYEAQNSTTGFDLETKVEKLDERESAIKQTRDKAVSDVANTQARLKEIYAEQQRIIQDQIKQAEELQPKFTGKKVYATVEQQTLVANLEAQKSFKTLTEYANYSETRTELIDQLTETIQAKTAVDDLTARIFTVQLVNDISDPEAAKEKIREVSIEEAIEKNKGGILEQILQNENILIETAKKGAILEAEQMKGSVFLTREIAENLFGEDVANEIYGPKQIKVILSSEQNEQTTHEVDLGNANKASIELYKDRYDFFEKVRKGGVDETKNIFRNQLGSNVNTYLSKKAISSPNSLPGKIGSSDAVKAILTKGSPNALELKYFGKNPILNTYFKYSPESMPYFKLFTEVTGVSVGVGVATKIIPLTYGGGGIPLAKIAYIQQVKSLGVPYTLGKTVGDKFAVGLGKKVAAQTAGKAAGQVVAEVAVGTATKTGVAATLSATMAAAGSVVPFFGQIIGAIVGWVVGKLAEQLPKIKKWLIENKEVFVGLAAGGGLLVGGPVVGGIMLFGALAAAGMLGTFAAGAFGVLGFIGRSIGIAIATPVIITLLVIPPLVAFIMLVINNSAYVVPPSSNSRSNPPALGPNIMGGLISNCNETEETGADITDRMASQIKNGVVKLLPNNVWGRSDGICITPTMIIMHWSGGTNDNPDGNQRTYETLVARNLSCQIATDTNDQWLMERFFENQVEFSACAGEWNTYGISNEMAGRYFTSNPPPPNLAELELAYDSTCKIMKQYNIPWTQIYGHYQVPNNGGKTDPGSDFLEKVFIPEIRRRCPNLIDGQLI